MRLPCRLFRRRFTEIDQSRFALLSGDTNPLHMDPVEARRTITGMPVVHGVHMVVAALDILLRYLVRSNGSSPSFSSLGVRFPRPALIGDTVLLQIEEFDSSRCRLAGYVTDDLVLDIVIGFGPPSRTVEVQLPSLPQEPLQDVAFADLAKERGTLKVGIDPGLAHKIFPDASKYFGLAALAEILTLSRLVGMRCPGRYSIFGQFDVKLGGGGVSSEMSFHVERTDDRFRRVDIAVTGSRVIGVLSAYYRPPPQAQANILEIADRVHRGEFSSRVALIVGGTRGLGEITAKLVAAGGGLPIITFHRGADDAERVAGEIRDWGGQCGVAHLDVMRPAGAIKRLFADKNKPRSIYYFATPKIFGRRRSFWGHDLFRVFCDYYVSAFGLLIDAAAAHTEEKLRVFFPSSIAVQEDLRELAEYVMAKRAAEDMCAFYNRYSSKVEILVERLPRIRTDQTSTLVEVPAEEGQAIMLPIVRRIELGVSSTN